MIKWTWRPQCLSLRWVSTQWSFLKVICLNLWYGIYTNRPSVLFSASWSYGSWIYNYQCNQCLSPLILWVRILIRARCTTLCDRVCQWLVIGRWFSPGPPVSSTIKIDHHDITEILLKVALNTIKPNQTDQINSWTR